MAKFYVQSGEINFVVTAADAEGAALWLVHRLINTHTPADPICQTANDVVQTIVITAALERLDSQLRVSEIGFGKHEAGLFETELVVKQWMELVRAMNWLLDQMNESAN